MDSTDPAPRSARFLLFALILIPIVFNAVVLLPELSIPIPSLNDDAFHYLFIQRASQALSNGENPFDHWMPELELGFSQFYYYQHLPHLTVVFLNRLLLKQVDLFTIFNLIRYLLLVCFPLTVYWSMQKMGFSLLSGAIGAAVSTLLSSKYGYGLESGSYVWGGHGMYTQLWAMHLSFIALACLYRLLEKGKGYLASVAACSALVLSHLIYSYMIAIAAIVLFFTGLTRTNIRIRLLRFALVALPALAITSYFWIPFLVLKQYLDASPYLERWKYDSFGAADILTRLVNGDMLDFRGFPVLTLLLALGVTSALFSRNQLAKTTLILFAVWLSFFFGRSTWGKLTDFLPMQEGMLFHRFIGAVHLAAILLIGMGGQWVWERLSPIPWHRRAPIAGLIFLIIVAPAIKKHYDYCGLNRQWMERTEKALCSNPDARMILSVLKALPPGRVYAGLRENWEKQLKIGDLNFYDLLTFHRIDTVSPPYQGLSFNSDLIWHFDNRQPSHYHLFDVRYVVAPRALNLPDFLQPIQETDRYRLYKVDTGGRSQFVKIANEVRVESQSALLSMNLKWLASSGPAEGRFIWYDYHGTGGKFDDKTDDRAVGRDSKSNENLGLKEKKISEMMSQPGRLKLKVDSPEAATLVLKTTYHPNWRVVIDNRDVKTFMASPSFIGFEVPAGNHTVLAEYRSPVYKTILMIFGACVLVASVLFRRWFYLMDGWIVSI